MKHDFELFCIQLLFDIYFVLFSSNIHIHVL